MNDAKGDLANTMKDFVSTFAPGKPEDTVFDKILQIFVEGAFDFIFGQALKPLHEFLDQTVKEGSENIRDTLDAGVDKLKDLAKEAGQLLV
jgi:hypothetical protein